MPSFTIEAPAEANPLSEESLLRVLTSASSRDSTQVQTGTKQLENWEHLNGFYSGLQSVYLNFNLPIEIRYLAILRLKNAVDKYWRKSAERTLAQEEKDLIRSRCVEGLLNEPQQKLALACAVFTAKILRSGSPQEGAIAVEDLVNRLTTIWKWDPMAPKLSRVLLLLLYIVKELATARLRTSQSSLRALAPGLAQAISVVHDGLFSEWMSFLQYGGDNEGGLLESMRTSLLGLRTLRRLLVFGFEKPNRDPTVQGIWPQLIAKLGRMLELVSPGSEFTPELHPMSKFLVERHLMQIAKLNLNMAKDHPAAYVLLPRSIDFTRSYWGFICNFGESYGKKQSKNLTIGADGDADDEDEISFSEQFSLKGLLLLRACMKMVYNPAQSFKYPTEADKAEKIQARGLMKDNLLTVNFAREVMESLVLRFFVFTPRDLKQWEEEPDEWEKSQEGMGDDWEFSLRVCSEKLFLDIIIHYKADLVPYLIALIMEGAHSMSNDVWLKDSIYAAIGLAAPVLYDTFDFVDFLESALPRELQIQHPDYNIIRRRVAIILGHWLPVKEGLDRPLVYEIFRHLLNKNDPLNDEVVRVTAGRKLGDVVDPFEFVADEFAPFARDIIERLLHLVQEVQLPETKTALLNTLHIIVVKMEEAIAPFGDYILSLLPPLWDAAADEILTKEMILGILTGLIESMKAESRKYHLSIVPLIASSTSLENSADVFMTEEALNLWSAVLDQTVTPAPQPTIDLFQNLLFLLQLGSEILDKALAILDAYIYLVPEEVVRHSPIIFNRFVEILKGDRKEVIGLITHSLDLLFCSADKLGGLIALEHIANSLHFSSFLPTLLSSLRQAYNAHQTHGPGRQHALIDGVVETDYLSILGRIAIASPDLFIKVNQAVGSGFPHQDWLLEEWFAHIDNISHPERKKLACLALTSFLETGQDWILNKLQLLMTAWTSVLTELENEVEDEKTGKVVKRDCFIYTLESLAESDGNGNGIQSPSVERSREITLADPVHGLDMRSYIREKLGIAIQKQGGLEAFTDQWVNNVVDEDIKKAFADLGIFD